MIGKPTKFGLDSIDKTIQITGNMLTSHFFETLDPRDNLPPTK
jgi:hypothetical protein